MNRITWAYKITVTDFHSNTKNNPFQMFLVFIFVLRKNCFSTLGSCWNLFIAVQRYDWLSSTG